MTQTSTPNTPQDATAVIVLADGTVFTGRGFGAETIAVGEICFNTSMTGYQEILTDPSYAGQIITFTFPHIGNVGTNAEDVETVNPASRGLIVREDITEPANWRAARHLDEWLKGNDLPGIAGIDTRALTRHIRDQGAPNGVIAVNNKGEFDLDALKKKLPRGRALRGWTSRRTFPAPRVTIGKKQPGNLVPATVSKPPLLKKSWRLISAQRKTFLRCLAAAGCDVKVMPATTTANDILAHKPDGVFLSNGPGDPAATGEYAIPMIKELLENDTPIFGICLGHQLLAQALGAKTRKMHLGHRGANQPVKDLETGKVEITSQNHGFEVVEDSLPENVVVTHTSLFDGSNEGIKSTDKKAFSVQYHPEASPGPQDSHYLFERFVNML